MSNIINNKSRLEFNEKIKSNIEFIFEIRNIDNFIFIDKSKETKTKNYYIWSSDKLNIILPINEDCKKNKNTYIKKTNEILKLDINNSKKILLIVDCDPTNYESYKKLISENIITKLEIFCIYFFIVNYKESFYNKIYYPKIISKKFSLYNDIQSGVLGLISPRDIVSILIGAKKNDIIEFNSIYVDSVSSRELKEYRRVDTKYISNNNEKKEIIDNTGNNSDIEMDIENNEELTESSYSEKNISDMENDETEEIIESYEEQLTSEGDPEDDDLSF